MLKPLVISCALLLFVFISNGQLVNLPQTFSPKAYFAHDHASKEDFNSNSSLLHLSIPIKTKAGIKLGLAQRKKNINTIEDVVKIQFSQQLIGLTVRNTVVELPSVTHTQQRIGISITNISYQKKLRFMLYRFGGNYYHTASSENTAFSANGLLAQMRIINLRNIVFYGVIGSWNHGNSIVLPVVGWMHKIDRTLSYILIFPSSAKFTYKINKQIKLDATTYVNTLRNQVVKNSIRYSSQFSQLRTGAQVRWKLGQSSVINLEAGVEYFSHFNQWNGFDKQTSTHLPNRPFVKFSFVYTFGKSLFNSNVLTFDLE